MLHDEDAWASKNRRRVTLINREFAEGLRPDEAEELRRLQAELDQRLQAEAPLPFETLERLEGSAREVVANAREQEEDPVPGSP